MAMKSKFTAFERKDMAKDRKAKIKENSKQDSRLDKFRGGLKKK